MCACASVFGSDGVKKQKHKQKNPQLVCSVSRWWHHSFIMCLALGKPAENKVPRDLQTYLSVLWFKWNRHTHTRTHTFPSSLRHTLQSVMSWNTTVFDVTVTAGHTCSQLFLLTLTGTGNNKKPGFGFKFRPSLLLEFVICTLCCLLKNTQMSQMLQQYKKVLLFFIWVKFLHVRVVILFFFCFQMSYFTFQCKKRNIELYLASCKSDFVVVVFCGIEKLLQKCADTKSTCNHLAFWEIVLILRWLS